MNTGKELSLRQVLAAVTLAGLSLAASQAGVVDWAWGLVGTAAAVPLLRWLMLRQGDKPLCRGGYGVVLRGLYCLWSVVVLGHVLVQAARRVELVGGSQGVSGWLLLLLALPVLWMSWGKCAAFFRGGEIYWMVLVAVLVAVGLLALPQVTVSYLWTRQGSGWTSALMGAGAVAMAAWVLPYLYKVSPRQRHFPIYIRYPPVSGRAARWGGGCCWRDCWGWPWPLSPGGYWAMPPESCPIPSLSPQG